MAEIIIQADTSRPKGSRASGRLRAEGKVPGVVYGLGRDTQTVAVTWRELRHALTTDAGLNTLIDLRIEGNTDLVMVKELQRHPVRREVLHVDFLRVSRDVAITVEVPINLEGEATEVLQADGVVDHVLFHLTITAKPADIPNEITVDVSGLQLGDSIHVRDLRLPEGVTTDVDPDESVVVTSAGVVEEPPEPTEAVEGEEAGEGGDEAVAEASDDEG